MNNEEREINAKLSDVIPINENEAGLVISGNEVTLYFGSDADADDKSTCSPSDILVLALGRIISHHSDFLMKVLDEVQEVEITEAEGTVSSDTKENTDDSVQG
jgi:hypothetical protein